MIRTRPIKRFVPFVIGAGLLTIMAILLLLSITSDPSRSSIPAMPPGTSTLSHGGPGPTR